MTGRTLAVALPLLLVALPAGADIYKWTDAQGRVHFSDQPSGGQTPAEPVEVRDYKPGSDEATRQIIERRDRLTNASADKAARTDSNALREAALKARTEKHCAEAREHLRKISGRVVFHDEDGKPVRVSEQERAAKQREAQDWIRAHCAAP
jgi:hypothetical protein